MVLELSNKRAPLCGLWFCSICKSSLSVMTLKVPLFSLANMTTSSLDNILVNLLNDSSNIYYGSFKRNSQNSQVKRWIKDDKHLIIRHAHIVVDEVTQLMKVIAYMVFHQTTEGENFLLTMSLQLKRQMRMRHLETKRNLSSLLVLVWTKSNITLSWLFFINFNLN